MTHRTELRHLRTTLDRAGIVPPDEFPAVVVRHLLDRLAVYAPTDPPDYDRDQAAAESTGWGMPCPGGSHRTGCAVAAGWETAALRGLTADPIRLWPPFDLDAWIGAPPPCYPRFLRDWFGPTAT